MGITLNGVTLNDQMHWTDEWTYTQVAQESARTLGGRLKIYSQALTKGRPITLEAVDDQGWLTKTQVSSIQGLAEVAGATYVLVIDAQTFQVAFRHEDGVAFQANALVPRINSETTDYFTCIINLVTV